MSKVLTHRRRPLAIVLIVMLLIVAACDRPGRSRATAEDQIELTNDTPVAVVEFEGSIVLSGTDDDIVASFFRVAPEDSRDLEHANVAEFEQEAWIGGEWRSYEPGSRPFISLSGPGSNVVRYRWTFVLKDGADSGVVAIEAGLTPAYGGPGGVTAPGEDKVPTVMLRIVSVTYP